ncbi:MAG: hydroxyethylthiazole kinase [Chloroflexi bacterium]|jgi:hydroxyethylthiazole kinase|nr:hydroxyethylthiazole kinase [Chloroflexota bacterium]
MSFNLTANDENWAEIVGRHLDSLRSQRPLVYCLTNFVTVNDVANGLAAIGASPVMSTAPDEAAELISYAGAVMLNPGTLNQEFIRLLREAVKLAGSTGKPCLLDPVGSGATRLRTETFQEMLQHEAVQLVRGNLGEIVSLAGVTASAQTKGVDSVGNSDSEAAQNAEAANATLTLQKKRGYGAVSATGQRDTATDGQRLVRVYNGHPWLPGISGSGCTVGGISAAFLAVAGPLEAAVSGLVCYAVAAEIAAEKSSGPGTLKVNIFDALYNLTPAQVRERASIKSFQVSPNAGDE